MSRVSIAMMLALSSAPVLVGAPALAQQSASHRMDEHAFNAGGHPAAGIGPASASHRLTLGSIGEPIALSTLAGPTMRLQGGFIAPYPPPGEVLNLMFSDQTTLHWDPEHSAGEYNMYRGDLASLSGLGYGACHQQGLIAATTTDATIPPVGGGSFYLVTVENRLGEEGTKGFSSSGIERGGLACP